MRENYRSNYEDSRGSEQGFVFGVGGLDSLLGGVLRPGSLLVVAGHPGAGKTTLGATLCAANASRGRRCVYFSVQEPRAKMVSNLRGVGVDLERLEEDGLVRIVKLPLVAGEDAVGEVLGEVARTVAEAGASVAVVDSVTPLLKAVGSSVRARSILQEFLASLPETMNGVLVLLAEIPILEERVELGDIEFVADAILLLTHTVERNRLVREIVIRKARGAPITIARLPFTITEKGIQVWVPPNLESIPAFSKKREYLVPCSLLKKLIGTLKGGMIVSAYYPVDSRPYCLLSLLLSMALYNNAKTLVVSYSMSSSQVRDFLSSSSEKKQELSASRIIGALIDSGKLVIKAYNPSAYSVEELYSREMEFIEEIDPDIVVFMGVDSAPQQDEPGLIDLLRNEMMHLKSKGILVFRFGALHSRRNYQAAVQLSDIMLRFSGYTQDQDEGSAVYIWITGKDPIVIDKHLLVRCGLEALAESIKSSNVGEGVPQWG